jgi:hypothetical protein
MTIVVTQFALPARLTTNEAKAIFNSTAPLYRGLSGLLRKHYLLSEDGLTAGAVYVWESRAEAEKLYTTEWRQFVTVKYGAEPSVVFFDNLVTVDNTISTLMSARSLDGNRMMCT